MKPGPKSWRVEHTGRGGRALDPPTGPDWKLPDRSHETAEKLVDHAETLYWRNRIRRVLAELGRPYGRPPVFLVLSASPAALTVEAPELADVAA